MDPALITKPATGPRYDTELDKSPEELVKDVQNSRQGMVERLNKAFKTTLDFSPLSLYQLAIMVYADMKSILKKSSELEREAFAAAIGYYLGFVFEDHVGATWEVGKLENQSFTHMRTPWGGVIDPLAVADAFMEHVNNLEEIKKGDIRRDYLLFYFYMYDEQARDRKLHAPSA